MSIVVDTPSSSEAPITESQETVAVETPEVVEAAPETQEPVANEPVSEIPEKYAGKTIEEVIEMHQNVEKALGRQGQEIGSQRKMIQDLLAKATPQVETTETTEEPTSFEEVFYEDPAKAVKSVIENDPNIQELKKANVQAVQQANVAKVEAAHPDFMDIVQDQKFLKWVEGSKIRTELFRNAHTNYDFDSANELFGTWKELSMITKTKEVKKEQKKSREKAMRQTSSESSTSGNSVGGKKEYRRSDLIDLQMRDPSRYASLADEIQLAYAEGRVR